MIEALYPLKFSSILKERIWGGQKLRTELNKELPNSKIGESWELSDVEGDISIVSNGVLSGQSLKQCLEHFGPKLMGQKNFDLFGTKFPLLIKFIDAKQDLSIQLHPNDELAAKRHNSFGKTEMWYVMQADKEANLIVGFNKKITPEIYLNHLKDKTLTQILNFENVKKGDTYFIEVGRVHAIGAGVMIAEIQQTSDITYRVYDWDRVGTDGRSRELHNDLAIDAIDFNMKNDYKVTYSKSKNQSNLMVGCPYFITNFIPLKGKILKKNNMDSFIIYICVDGEVELVHDNTAMPLSKGETVLIPASISTFELRSENANLLEVYI